MFVAPATHFYPNDKQSNMASRINRAGGEWGWGDRVGPENAQQYQEKQKLRSHSEPTRLTPPPLNHLSKQDASFFPPSSISHPTKPAGSSFMRAHRNRQTSLTVLQPLMWNARERSCAAAPSVVLLHLPSANSPFHPPSFSSSPKPVTCCVNTCVNMLG